VGHSGLCCATHLFEVAHAEAGCCSLAHSLPVRIIGGAEDVGDAGAVRLVKGFVQGPRLGEERA
jgi:hypothetical protein